MLVRDRVHTRFVLISLVTQRLRFYNFIQTLSTLTYSEYFSWDGMDSIPKHIELDIVACAGASSQCSVN